MGAYGIVSGQSAELKTVKGVYRIDFVAMNPDDTIANFWFCKEIFYRGPDDSFFMGESIYNEYILNSFPELQKSLGQEFVGLSRNCETHFYGDCRVFNNLMCFDVSDGKYSNQFFYPNYPDRNRVSILFNLEAVIIEYKNLPFWDLKSVIKTGIPSPKFYKDCWGHRCPDSQNFGVMVKVLDSYPLKRKQIRKMNLKRYEKLKISVFTHQEGSIFYID